MDIFGFGFLRFFFFFSDKRIAHKSGINAGGIAGKRKEASLSRALQSTAIKHSMG